MSEPGLPVKITECFSDKPLFDIKAVVERLLRGIPKKYISGLDTVVLMDNASFNHERRRAKVRRLGKKVRMRECSGLYHKPWKGEPAWIELFVDNMLARYEDTRMFKLLMRLSIMRDFVVGRELYHELGHHINKTIVPEHGDIERIADKWKRCLMRNYLRREYWYLIPIFFFLHPFSKLRRAASHKTT